MYGSIHFSLMQNSLQRVERCTNCASLHTDPNRPIPKTPFLNHKLSPDRKGGETTIIHHHYMGREGCRGLSPSLSIPFLSKNVPIVETRTNCTSLHTGPNAPIPETPLSMHIKTGEPTSPLIQSKQLLRGLRHNSNTPAPLSYNLTRR